MKKFLVSVLATSMCLACLTACGGDKKVATDLDGAAEWVESLYQDVNVSVNRDYEVVNSVLYDGQTYSVTWSVDVTDGVKVVKGSEMTTVDVNEVSEVDIEYVLTATVKDANGDTKTVTFNRVVKAASDKVPGPIQSAPEEETPYKLHLYHKNKQKDCYFVGEMSSFYFKTSEDPEKAVDIYVEYKADSETEFYPYFLDSNETKQYIGMKVSADGKHNNIVYETAPVSVFVWNDELKTITTTIVDSDGKETEFFIGVQQKYDTMQACDIKYKDDNNIAHLIGMIDRNSVDAAEKVKQEKNVLTAPRAFVGEASYDLAELGLTFADVKITWAVAGEGASVNGNVLTVKAGADTATVKLTATLSCGDASDTAEFDVVIVPNDAAKIMAAGDALGDGGKFANEVTFTGVVTKVNSKYDAEYGNVTVTIDVNGTSVYCYRVAGAGADVLAEGYTVTVKGFIENFKGSAQIGQGGTIVDYVAGEAPEKPDAPNSSSSSKDDGDSSVSTPDDEQVASISLTTNSMGITTENGAYSSEEKSVTVSGVSFSYVQVGNYGNGLQWRTNQKGDGVSASLWNTTALSGKLTKIVFTHNANKEAHSGNAYSIALGTTVACDGTTIAAETSDTGIMTVTVNGDYTFFKITHANTYSQYWDSIEIFFVADDDYVPDDDTSSSVGGNTSSSTPDDDTSSSVGGGTSSSTPDDSSSSSGSQDNEMTIAEALKAAEGTKVVITGTVVKITYSYNSEFDNISVDIADENGIKINAFRMKGNVNVGQIIKVTGAISPYNGVNQIGEGSTFEAVGTHSCSNYAEATCKGPATCIVCGTAQEGSAAVSHNYVNGVCKWCASPEGVQTQTVTVSIATYADTNAWENGVQYTSITMNDAITVTASGTATGNYGVNTGKYYENGENWRIYQNENPSVTITAAEGKTIVSVKITYAVKNTGTLTLNGNNVASDEVVAVNGSSVTFSVGNTGTATNGQAQITAIEVVYA